MFRVLCIGKGWASRKAARCAGAIFITFAALPVLPSIAIAQCTDTFNIILAGGTPAQTAYPLGIGASLNALVSTMNTVNTAFLTNSASFVSAPGGATPDQQGSGVWSRTVGGYVDTKATSVSTIDNSNKAPPGPVVTGTGTCKGTVHQQYFGSQLGIDTGVLNIGSSGANIHFGLTGGYFDAKSKDLTGPGPIPPTAIVSFPEGNLKGDFQVPFVGAYAAFSQGKFFADAQVRFDFYQNELSDRSNGLSGDTVNAKGVSATANTGYNFSLGGNWFIEPSVGVVWSHVTVDDLKAPGTTATITGGLPPTTTMVSWAKGTVTFDDIESLLGRASIRTGTTIASGIYTWQPFLSASVFKEFAANAVAHSTVVGGPNDASVLNSATSRIGTYGQFGAGSALVFGNSGWLSYGRVDYKTGENVQGVGVNVGLRYQW